MNNFSPLSDVRYLPPLRDSMQDNFSYKSARVCAVSFSNKQNSNLIIFGKFPISENLIRTMPSRRAKLKFSLEMNDIINCRSRSETTVPSSVRLKCKWDKMWLPRDKAIRFASLKNFPPTEGSYLPIKNFEHCFNFPTIIRNCKSRADSSSFLGRYFLSSSSSAIRNSQQVHKAY